MENRRPVTGEIYRHFKNKLYQIVAVATHSETGEELVIYQGLYGDYRVYARPLAMFVSPVDHEKYPQVTQKYRFEKVERAALAEDTGNAAPGSAETVGIVLENKAADAPLSGDRAPAEPEAADEAADPRLLAFLDAETCQEKYRVIKSLENDITDRLINDFAVVLDVVIPEGDLQERYMQLKQCVATMCRYETTRLR